MQYEQQEMNGAGWNAANAGLRTDQIVQVLVQSAMLSCSAHFLGVFAADQIPSADTLIESSPSWLYRHSLHGVVKGFVANTDPSNAPGSHWVAFVSRGSVNTIDYFDSYGFPLSTYVVLHAECTRRGYFKYPNEIRTINENQLQDFDSVACGHYCILFLDRVFRCKEHSSVQVVARLRGSSSSTTQRDKSVVDAVNMLRHRYQHRSAATCDSACITDESCNQCCVAHTHPC